MRPYTRALLLTACLVLTAATATNREVNAAAATRTVVIEGLKYNPGELTVHRGERIVWVNKDFFPHTVTADKQAFDSGSIAANGTWSYLARKPGEYAYSCTFHPTMKGKITVQ